MFNKGGYKVLASLFAIADYIYACGLLLVQGNTQGVVFAIYQLTAL